MQAFRNDMDTLGELTKLARQSPDPLPERNPGDPDEEGWGYYENSDTLFRRALEKDDRMERRRAEREKK